MSERVHVHVRVCVSVNVGVKKRLFEIKTKNLVRYCYCRDGHEEK